MDFSERPVQEWRKQAFDFASDSTKQLITMATGVVTVTVLFSKDLDSVSRYLALAAWIALTLSVMSGVAALLNMSGNLHNAADDIYRAPTIKAFGIRFFSLGQIGLFLCGIILVFLFGFFAARARPAIEDKALNVTCVLGPSASTTPIGGSQGNTQPIATPSPQKRYSNRRADHK